VHTCHKWASDKAGDVLVLLLSDYDWQIHVGPDGQLWLPFRHLGCDRRYDGFQGTICSEPPKGFVNLVAKGIFTLLYTNGDVLITLNTHAEGGQVQPVLDSCFTDSLWPTTAANKQCNRADCAYDEGRRADHCGEKKGRDGEALQQILERTCGCRIVGDSRENVT